MKKNKAQPGDDETGTFWIDSDGIFMTSSDKLPASKAKLKENFENIKRMAGQQKVCMIIEVSASTRGDKKMMEYVKQELPAVCKAVAVVSSSVFTTMIANAYLSGKTFSLPVKAFSGMDKAKAWLKQFL